MKKQNEKYCMKRRKFSQRKMNKCIYRCGNIQNIYFVVA